MTETWEQLVPHVSEIAFELVAARDDADYDRQVEFGTAMEAKSGELAAAGYDPDDIMRAQFYAMSCAGDCAADLALLNAEGMK